MAEDTRRELQCMKNYGVVVSYAAIIDTFLSH